jgi:HEAT repeat protein
VLSDPFETIENALATELEITDEMAEAVSGLLGESLFRFRELWERLGDEARATLVSRLGEAAEENLVLDFLPIYRLALDDREPTVRELAYRFAAEDAPRDLLDRYLRAAVSDEDPNVRAAATEGLEHYTLAAQLDDWPVEEQGQLERALTGLLHLPGADLRTRRSALLSLSYLTTPGTEAEIRQAYTQPDMHDAAIEAMGRNCQTIWIPDLTNEIRGDDEDRRILAAEAFGELADEVGVPLLLERLQDPSLDVALAAVAALGEIGGSEAKSALSELLTSRDRDLRDAARDAMEVLLTEEDPFSKG